MASALARKQAKEQDATTPPTAPSNQQHYQPPKRLAVTLEVDELEALMERASAAGAAKALDQHKPAAWTDQDGICAHLGISVPTLREHIKEDGLPFSWTGHLRKFCVEEVDAWMKTHQRRATAKD